MMLKNETKRLHVSLNSIKDFADSLVVYDTGSTDDTIEICEKFCKENNIIFRLKQGEFENFSTSRNISLDFADSFEDIDYILLMDCNDELIGGEMLRKEAKIQLKNDDITSFLITQEWFSGTVDSYFNVRFIKAHKGWRYKGVVHEYITIVDKETNTENKPTEYRLNPQIKLYQDRTQDDDKSNKRFTRDKKLLLEEYEKNPTDSRTTFYLAQTFACLNDHENAYRYYKERIELVGFWEEVFQSYLKCGDLSVKLKHDWYQTFTWYMKAFEHTQRVEPLLRIAEYYKEKNNFILSYTFLTLACKLKYPDHCILFVDKLSYDYKRWHLMGISAFYVEEYGIGKECCLKAIESGLKIKNINIEVDKKNLNFYLEKEKESNENTGNENTGNENMGGKTKNEFIKFKVSELKKAYPKSTSKQLIQMAKLDWKNKNKL